MLNASDDDMQTYYRLQENRSLLTNRHLPSNTEMIHPALTTGISNIIMILCGNMGKHIQSNTQCIFLLQKKIVRIVYGTHTHVILQDLGLHILKC